jgi:hypothetical protein
MPSTCLVRVVAPHFVAGLVLADDRCAHAAPILRWCIGKSWSSLAAYFVGKHWSAERFEESIEMMNCLACGSEAMKARVELAYDVPLAARNGGIKIGGLKVTQLDLRAAWEKLEHRPIYCHECSTKHIYTVATKALEVVDE